MPTKFEKSKEAEGYVNGLIDGNTNLPEEANNLEQEALNQVRTLRQSLANLAGRQSSIEKQIGQLQAQLTGARRDADVVSGQIAAYAQMLVSAEGARREAIDNEIPGGPIKRGKKKRAGTLAVAKEDPQETTPGGE